MPTLAYYWNGAAHVLVGILVLLVFVAAITAMVVFVARLLGAAGRGVLPPAGSPSPPPAAAPAPHETPVAAPAAPAPSALEILARRLASGEITVEQYDEVRAKLES
ncbi:MAG: SHOCT domain-containing protein [Solirubrobacteraceae bacterium]|jgi:uncharacterized membrane protein